MTHAIPGPRLGEPGIAVRLGRRDRGRSARHGAAGGAEPAERLDNATYEQGDAQVHPFARAQLDLAISRFGAMFFSDPVAAFSKIAGALRPNARLVLFVWQSLNGTSGRRRSTPRSATRRRRTPTSRSRSGVPSLRRTSSPTPASRAALQRRPRACLLRPDIAAALEFVRGLQRPRELLAAGPADAARALERLTATLGAHQSDHEGVVFDSRAWIITARRC